MRLDNYIMEQDINTASVADIFVEQAQAEMNVMLSIAESYVKETTYESFIQEGAAKDAATIAKGSKYENKVKRVLAFIPRFIINFVKIVISKLKKMDNPINGIKAKFAKVPDDVKNDAVIPISKENLQYANHVMQEIEKILDRSEAITSKAAYGGDAAANGVLLKLTDNINKLITMLNNYDVEKRLQDNLSVWKKEQDRQKKNNTDLSAGKTKMSVTVDDGVSGPNNSKPSMPDLVMKTPETKELATIKEFEAWAADYVEARKETEKGCKEMIDAANEMMKFVKGDPSTSSTGVTTADASYSDLFDPDYAKHLKTYMDALSRLSVAFTKLFDNLEKAFQSVLKDTKAYKAYKAPKVNKVPDENAADNYKVDINAADGNWGSSRTKSGGNHGKEPELGDTPERIASYYL